jgi:hypothetical protein
MPHARIIPEMAREEVTDRECREGNRDAEIPAPPRFPYTPPSARQVSVQSPQQWEDLCA